MPLSQEQNTTELDRLFLALAARTQIEAAKLLEVRQSALSDCKRRGGIVTGNVLEKAFRFGISPEWIKTGTPPMKKEEAEISKKKCAAGRYCLEVCPALEALRQALHLVSHCGYICEACEHNPPQANKADGLKPNGITPTG